jgi:predicted nucleotide-binding protein (sugar kinase/HSP70/actin superfamily)
MTRIEAYFNTNKNTRMYSTPNILPRIDNDFAVLQDKILWLPDSNEGAKMLASAFIAYGIDARILPRSPNVDLDLARKKIYTDVCLPMLVTTEDILYRVNQRDFQSDNEWFFQGNSNGPCRFGMYAPYQNKILAEMGIGENKIMSLGKINGKMGIMFAKIAFDTMLCHDILFKMLSRTRPYEKNHGQSQSIFNKYIERLMEITPEYKKTLEGNKIKVMLGFKHHGLLQTLLLDAQTEFKNVEKTGIKKPLVGVLGEFFVRINEFSNQKLISKLESLGLETWLASMTEFFSYSVYISKLLASQALTSGEFNSKMLSEWAKSSIAARLSHKSEQAFSSRSFEYLKDYEEIEPEELVTLGSHYIIPDYGGEPICTMGKMEDFAYQGLKGIITTMPMSCIPGITALVMSQKVSSDYGIPILNLDYDGFPETNRRKQEIETFAEQINDQFVN